MLPHMTTTYFSSLSLHDALPISLRLRDLGRWPPRRHRRQGRAHQRLGPRLGEPARGALGAGLLQDRKSTRLNSITRPLRMPSSAGKKKLARMMMKHLAKVALRL